MSNIFENAYFGKPYKTRDGRKALFIKKDLEYNFPYALIIEEDIGYIRYDDTAKYINDMPELDIVSEWHEEINEEELDRLAYDICNNVIKGGQGYVDDDIYTLERGFKAGYRKAKGE